MRGAPARGPLTHPDDSRSDTRHSYLGKRPRSTPSTRQEQTGSPRRNVKRGELVLLVFDQGASGTHPGRQFAAGFLSGYGSPRPTTKGTRL